MGTSADYGGRTGGAWSPHKNAATRYAHGTGGPQPRARDKVLATFARAVRSGRGGGGGGAGGGGGGGGGGGRRVVGGGAVAPAQALAAFGVDLAENGLEAALRSLDLGYLIGRDRWEVMNGLFETLAGDGSTLDEASVQQALVETLGQLYPEELQTYRDLDGVALDATGVTAFVETFIGEYVYADISHLLGVRLQECSDAASQKRLDDDIRDKVQSLVTIEIGDRDQLRIDWAGTEGQGILEAVTEKLQTVMEGLDA